MAAPPGDGAAPLAPEGPDAGDHHTRLRDLLDEVMAVAQEADDEDESLLLQKVATMLQQILTQQAKQDRELLQGKIPPGALQRVLGGG